jgi:hypothetical protein
MISVLKSYMVQTERLYREPFCGRGKRLNIIHLAGLYLPKLTNQRRGMSGERESQTIRTP